jgi:hypothetical protein
MMKQLQEQILLPGSRVARIPRFYASFSKSFIPRATEERARMRPEHLCNGCLGLGLAPASESS